MVNCCELLIAEHRRTEEILGRLSTLLEDIFCTSAYSFQSWQSVRKLYDTLAQDLQQHFALEE